MSLIVDASVAVKWVVPEPDSGAAEALLDLQPDLAAPSLLWIEAANALWARRHAGKMSPEEVLERVDRLEQVLVRRIPSAGLIIPATELALELRHPLYDCVYLACALEQDSHVVTADSRFLKVVSASPRLARRVRRLGA